MRGVPSVNPSGLREVPLTFGLLLLPLSVRGVLSICCASEHSTSPALPVWFGRVSAFSVAQEVALRGVCRRVVTWAESETRWGRTEPAGLGWWGSEQADIS